jgi:mycoredoxin
MTRRWGQSMAMFALAIAIGGFEFATGHPYWGVLFFLILAVIGLLVSPRAFPRSVTDAEARATGRPIVYWRPGCPFCLRLRGVLGRDAGRLSWVDIWSDPAGAASVRAVANGNETVPTVVLNGDAMVNPDPRRIRRLVGDGAAR